MSNNNIDYNRVVELNAVWGIAFLFGKVIAAALFFLVLLHHNMTSIKKPIHPHKQTPMLFESVEDFRGQSVTYGNGLEYEIYKSGLTRDQFINKNSHRIQPEAFRQWHIDTGNYHNQVMSR